MKRIRAVLGDGQEVYLPCADANAELTFRLTNGWRLRMHPRFPIENPVAPGVINVPLTRYTLAHPEPATAIGTTISVPLTTYTLTLPVPDTGQTVTEAPLLEVVPAFLEGQVRLAITLFRAPTYTITVTLNGAPVTPVQIDPFLLAIPITPSASAQTVAWTAVATNAAGITTVPGTFTLTATLAPPDAPSDTDWALYDTISPPDAPIDQDWTLTANDAPTASVPDAPDDTDWTLTEPNVDAPPPDPSGGLTVPTGVTLTVISDTSIQVAWTNGSGSPTSHDIEWSIDETTWTVSANRTSPYTLDVLPWGGTRYGIRVKAKKASDSATSAVVRATTHMRHYGKSAEWNVPITTAAARGAHPNESYIRDVLWIGSANPGWINMFDRDYTYPVYLSSQATTIATVAVSFGNWNGRQIPWNPTWVIPSGTDNQIILLNEVTGEEFNAWQIRYDPGTNRIVPSFGGSGRVSRVTAATDGDANAVPGDYRSKVNGFAPSRGCGLQYLALLIRPQEIAQGVIHHAVGCVMRRSGFAYHARPAYKSERFPAQVGNLGIPQGTRFWIDKSDVEIGNFVDTWPSVVPNSMRDTMEIVFRAMRIYGAVANDQGGGNHIQFEHTATGAWAPYGLDRDILAPNGKTYPRDCIDGLITDPAQIKVVKPPDDVMFYARFETSEDRRPTPLIGTISSAGVPQISGGTSVGNVLSVTRAGQFMGEATVTVTRQWMRGSTEIAGQTGTTYTVQNADRGFDVYCRFKGANAAGTSNHDSNRIFIP
jgi:hypothetical protein